MRRQTRHLALTVSTALLAAALIATSALTMMIQSSPVQSQSVPAPAAIQDSGPEAFGVLPAIRPQDGDGLDFSGPGMPLNPGNPIVNLHLPPGTATYTFDTMGTAPDAAPVVRLTVATVTEQSTRDLAARLGMGGPLQVVHGDGKWDYQITATDAATGAQVSVSTRGSFTYHAPDPGARCGEATIPPPVNTPYPNSVPATPTSPPFGTGTDLCQKRAAATDDAHAIAAAHDFLVSSGFPPDPTSAMHILPPDTRTPTLRRVQWAAVAPNGGPLVGREAQMDDIVTIGPDNRVTDASVTTRTPDAFSSYRLHPAADLAAALQTGDAYATLMLPNDASGYPIAFTNGPLAVHVTAATLGYSLAYTFDATPYLLPVMIYTGTATTNESAAIGKEIAFTAYVDAIVHPAPQPAPVTPTVPLPSTPDLASLTSFTINDLSFTRADFDALAVALGFDNATATVTSTPSGSGEGFLAKYPDGSNLGANYQGGEWQYDSGAPNENTPATQALSPEATLALVQQFIAAHHVDLSDLGVPVAQSSSVCYPLLIHSDPFADGRCGLRAFVASSGKRLTITADPLLVALQRNGLSALQPMAPTGSALITAQDALDTLATAPTPVPVNGGLSQLQGEFGRLMIEDDPEQAVHHRDGNIFYATRGQAAPNSFTADRVTLAYVATQTPHNPPNQTATLLQPVWLISGQIDIGNRHRIAPFTYVYPAVR
ncbi:MAG: hypothetical protein ACR2JW_04880 [Thermomicrobiales bacterium]